MEPVRDLARTRDRILKAALAEFAAHGLAGARCNAIARRARVNHRMLFYCFGSKENLYREILRRKFTERTALFERRDDDLAGTILRWYEAVAGDQDWVRLLEWEALSTAPAQKLVGERERRSYISEALEALRRSQANGGIPRDLNLAQLHLSIIALAVFPLAFPQMTRLATGLSPTSARFRRQRLRFLRSVSARLQMKSPERSRSGAVREKPRTALAKTGSRRLSNPIRTMRAEVAE